MTGGHDPDAAQFLFSYGTLQDERVQLTTFGKKLESEPDALIGYMIALIPVEDARFKSHGDLCHRNLQFTGNEADSVEGLVLKVTREDLDLADRYEPPDYGRVLVRLRSGISAWVYLSPRNS